MSSKLFVGSLAWAVSDESLTTAFSAYGTVVSAKVIKDRESGRSRGFGFVEMSSNDEADNAIKALNNSTLSGRNIVVSLANSK